MVFVVNKGYFSVLFLLREIYQENLKCLINLTIDGKIQYS